MRRKLHTYQKQEDGKIAVLLIFWRLHTFVSKSYGNGFRSRITVGNNGSIPLREHPPKANDPLGAEDEELPPR